MPNKQTLSLDFIKEYVENYNEKSEPQDIEVFHTLIIYPGTGSESGRPNMLRFINHIRYPIADVMIITQTKLSNSVMKGVSALSGTREHARHTFNAYTYNLLTTVIPEFELAPKYEILSERDAHEFDLDSLSKIFVNDPQAVWIGAKVGQVLKYTYLSEITIYAIGYCVVAPALD